MGNLSSLGPVGGAIVLVSRFGSSYFVFWLAINFCQIELDKVLLWSLPMVRFMAWAMSGKILIAATYGYTVLQLCYKILVSQNINC